MMFTLVPTAMAEGETAVAKVGDVEYETLQAAINAATAGQTVKLVANTAEDIKISADKDITLDLGNSKLTNKSGDTITVEKGGKLSISDSVGTGVVDNTSHGKGAIVNSGEVTLNGGTFKRSAEKGTYSPYVNGGNSWYTIANYGTMEINTGVTVENAGGYSSMIRNGGDVTADCNLTIEGGNFAGGVNTVKNDSFGVLTINGGNFSNTAQYVIMNWNKAEITAGTFQTLDTASAVLFTSTYGNDANTVGKLTISGGEFKHASHTQEMIVDHYDESNSGAAAVTGGSFSQSVERKYLDRSLNAELKRASGETPYSYYTSMNDALAAAKPGDTVTDLNATTESKVTLTLKYNDGATADTTYNVASGTTITLPTPAHRSGYTFNGWYDGSKFYAAGASYKVSATATLNASWSYISSGSSSYDPTYSVSTPSKTENGSVTVSPKSASKGDTVTITVKPNSGYVLETLTVTDKNGNELTLKDKGDGKYTFTMPAGKVEVKATFMEDNSMLNFFYDVPNGAYFYEAVKWAVKNGITTGVGNDLFAPEQPCTRAQIVTFLWRAAGSPEPKTMSSFTDVPASAYYAKAVAWAVENGITNGMTATMFAPDATCTRGQSVTFLHRALKGTASSSANFTDVKSDAFYADAINWAVANNVTNGTSNTTFSPDADCTRAEIVTFLYRAYQGK